MNGGKGRETVDGRREPPVEDLRLVPATERDWPRIRSWITRPDIERWWGTASAAEAEVRLALETEQAIARLIMLDGAPIGYAQAIDASYWGASLPQAMPAGTWDVDLFIAEKEQRGRGLGERALSLLADEVFSTTLAPALSVFIPLSREPAVRAYERAGFAWAEVWDDPIFGPSWLMLKDRPRR